MEPHPVRVVVTDDLRRSRLTVLFRIFLVLPQLVWILIWGIVVYGSYRYTHFRGGATTTTATGGTITLAALVTLFSGWLWPELHAFHTRFLRWSTHLGAYLFLIANPWPRLDARDEYPVEVHVDPPARQNRWVSFFRLLLAIPALIFSFVLVVVLVVVGLVGWFVCLLLGRMPKGMRDLGVYCLRFSAQTAAYVLYLTDRYPQLGTGAPVAPEKATIDHLKKLQDLREAGVLTDAEFEEKRRLLLDRPPPEPEF